MPGPISRFADELITGHGCEKKTELAIPILNSGGFGSVYAQGSLIARQFDLTIWHLVGAEPYCVEHIAPIHFGVPTVIVLGKMVATISSPVDAGFMIQGAPRVTAGMAMAAIGAVTNVGSYTSAFSGPGL